MRNVQMKKSGVSLLLLAACAGLPAPSSTNTAAASIVTPTPVCSAYVGTGDFEDVDLASSPTVAKSR